MKAKMLAMGVALATSLVAVSPASALVIAKYVTGGTGPHQDIFTPAFTLGNLPAEFLNETKGSCKTNKCTYDFVFQLAGLEAGDSTSIQIAAQALDKKHTAENISFDVFSGVHGANASKMTDLNFLGASIVSTAPVLALNLGNGKYFVQITASQVTLSGEASSGSLVETIVPEPMAWTLMLLGFGGIGAATRRRRCAATSGA